MKTEIIAAFAVLCIFLLCAGFAKQKVTTNWIGCPVVSDDDPYWPRQKWLSGVKIGLRSDGVVVWKKVSDK